MVQTKHNALILMGIISGALAALLTILTLLAPRIGAHASGISSVATARSAYATVARTSYLYRFDPGSSSYVFAFAVPLLNADARAVAGGDGEVWFTESGADRIGRLVFTSTTDYAYTPYTLTAGSGPLELALTDDWVWFTAPGGSYIGRLDPATGVIDQFQVAAGSVPADLDVAGDGSVWFTASGADAVGHLVVTSTVDYAVATYTTALLSGGRPYGIVVSGSGVIYIAQTANDRVSVFTPPNEWVHIQATGFIGLPDDPYDLVIDGLGRVWGTERTGNRVSQYDFGTYPIVIANNVLPARSLPTAIDVDGSNRLWFTQSGAGQIGRLTPTVPPQRHYYPLPRPGLIPTGIAVDEQGAVWVVASEPRRTYVPLIRRS